MHTPVMLISRNASTSLSAPVQLTAGGQISSALGTILILLLSFVFTAIYDKDGHKVAWPLRTRVRKSDAKRLMVSQFGTVHNRESVLMDQVDVLEGEIVRLLAQLEKQKEAPMSVLSVQRT